MPNKLLVFVDLALPIAMSAKIIINASLVMKVSAFLIKYVLLILPVQVHLSNTMETALLIVHLDTTVKTDIVSDLAKPSLIP